MLGGGGGYRLIRSYLTGRGNFDVTWEAGEIVRANKLFYTLKCFFFVVFSEMEFFFCRKH